MNNFALRRLLPDLDFEAPSILGTQNPLANLATTRSDAATEIMHRMLDIQERQQETDLNLGRMALMANVSHDLSSEIRTLISVNPGCDIHIDSSADEIATDNAFLFPRGQRVSMHRTFHGTAIPRR